MRVINIICCIYAHCPAAEQCPLRDKEYRIRRYSVGVLIII